MKFDDLATHSIGMIRHLFEDQGYLHAMALFDKGKGRSLGIYHIAEGEDDDDAVSRFNEVVRRNGIRAYAAAYPVVLSGGKEDERMDASGSRVLDYAGPKHPQSIADMAGFDPAQYPEQAILIVLASVHGDRKTLFFPVTGPKSLGEAVDVTDDMHSPFAEVFDAPGSRGMGI